MLTVCRAQQKSERSVQQIDFDEIRRSKYCCVYVKNFSYDLDEMDLWKIFSAYGIIRKVRVSIKVFVERISYGSVVGNEKKRDST